MPHQDPSIHQVAAIIAASQRLVVLSGAGISKESGIPTFRDALDGLWARYDPEELATPFAFQRDPKLVWSWYEYRRELIARSQPNPGHYALVEMEKRLPQLVIVTQNVDGLHHEAGSSDVIELHGNIRRNRCFQNCQGDPTIIDISTLEYDKDAGPPLCPHCGAFVRPNVVWYHEGLPEAALRRAVELAVDADVMLVVGTAGVVYPAARLPFTAYEAGATIIQINPQETPINEVCRFHLDGPSGEILPLVLAAMPEPPDA